MKKVQNKSQLPGKIGRYEIVKQIGEGSFGKIYQAVQESNTKQTYAIKTEEFNQVKPMLLIQYQIYSEFSKLDEIRVPNVYEFVEEETFSYLVMEVMDCTLDQFLVKRFSCKDSSFPSIPIDIILNIMSQTIKTIMHVHQLGYVYRDMKPANFMLKQPFTNLYLIDFGLCRKYIKNQKHILMKQGKKLVGTPIFCSRWTHAGFQQSRRDDLQSWIFMIFYLIMPLPWESIINQKELSKDEQYKMIESCKMKTNLQDLFKTNKKFPRCLTPILNSVEKLQFEERPNYQYFLKLIADEYKKITLRQIPEIMIWQSQILNEDKIKENKKIKINFKLPKKSEKNIEESSQLNRTQKQNRLQ